MWPVEYRFTCECQQWCGKLQLDFLNKPHTSEQDLPYNFYLNATDQAYVCAG